MPGKLKVCGILGAVVIGMSKRALSFSVSQPEKKKARDEQRGPAAARELMPTIEQSLQCLGLRQLRPLQLPAIRAALEGVCKH